MPESEEKITYIFFPEIRGTGTNMLEAWKEAISTLNPNILPEEVYVDDTD